MKRAVYALALGLSAGLTLNAPAAIGAVTDEQVQKLLERIEAQDRRIAELEKAAQQPAAPAAGRGGCRAAARGPGQARAIRLDREGRHPGRPPVPLREHRSGERRQRPQSPAHSRPGGNRGEAPGQPGSRLRAVDQPGRRPDLEQPDDRRWRFPQGHLPGPGLLQLGGAARPQRHRRQVQELPLPSGQARPALGQRLESRGLRRHLHERARSSATSWAPGSRATATAPRSSPSAPRLVSRCRSTRTSS